MGRLREIMKFSVDLLFPIHCPVCDDLLKMTEEYICRECRGKLRYITEPVCMKCGKMLHEDRLEYCYDCSNVKHIYDRGVALYDYKTISDSIYRFKYKGRQEYADFYAEEIIKHLGREIMRMKPDALIPVPIHQKRLRKRGYNQAAVLARAVSRRINIPVKDGLIVRYRQTAPQKELNEKERQNNLKKAFKISQNDVKLNTIVIIDDIYTTGNTINSVAAEFRGRGVDKIYYVALAIGRGI